MATNIYQISLTFEQILELVKQLSPKEKLLLGKELEKEVINQKLTELLEVFKSDELELATINEEVEQVRAEIYERSQTN
ncbi:MAG: type II toxin-antitoxin system VapB15 family antitoxin [Pleurocapsa sp.]